MTVEPRYPILVETMARCPLPDGALEPPGDVYVAQYEQGGTLQDDTLGWPFPVAATESDERSPSWGDDGQVHFLAGPVLYSARPGRLRPEPVVELPGLEEYVVLPGGAGFVLSTVDPGRHLWLADASGANLRPLEVVGLHPGSILRGPDRRGFLLANSEGLFLVSLPTGRHLRLAKGSFHEPSLSPDGASMVYLRHPRGAPTQVRVRHLRTGRERQVATQPKGCFMHAPCFSPDGTRVFFSTLRYGEELEANVWVVATTGGRPHQLDLHGHFQAARLVPRVA